MKFYLLLFILVYSCASDENTLMKSQVEIIEVKADKWTALTKQNLEHLLKVYDLSPFLFTTKIHIERMVIPKSHPILTINTRNAEKPNKILAVFLHEQLHWWVNANKKRAQAAIKELKKLFPQAPVTSTSGPDSTHLKLIVCLLEYKALTYYLGRKESKKIVVSIMRDDKLYPWVYHQVLNNDKVIEKIVRSNQLLPSVLN
jgi:hypothetical protein